MKRFSFVSAILTILSVFMPDAQAQRDINNIYLFDCTNSMIKARIWEPAKNALFSTIESQSKIPSSSFVIIPFGDRPYPTSDRYEFSSIDYQYNDKLKPDIEATFEKCIKISKSTSITESLAETFRYCDFKKQNNIYILTDGQPNGSDRPEKLINFLKNTCGKLSNTRIFYVMLHPDAVNPIIENAVNDCDSYYGVKCNDGIIPQFLSIAKNVIRTNIEELDKVITIKLDTPTNIPYSVQCTDPLFKVTSTTRSTDKNAITVKITCKENLTSAQLHSALNKLNGPDKDDYTFSFRVMSTDKNYVIVNPEVKVIMADHIQSSLTLCDGNDQLKGENHGWYDKFLWSKASVPGYSEFDLSPIFANNTPQSSITLSCKKDSDYKVLFNGEVVDNYFTITPGEKAIIKIEYNSNAVQGDYFLELNKTSANGIDLVNNTPIQDFEGVVLKGKYSVDWNPLKTILFWIGIILLALLILWLSIVNKIVYPRIKAKKMIITGPAPYSRTKKIKGIYKIVMSTQKKEQNILSRLFIGKIVYIAAPHFTPGIEATAGSGKKVKFRSEGTSDNKWIMVPSAILKPFEKTEVRKATSDNKFTIEIQ